ncbi:uncharacterized protein ISCGN_012255 [Ixodes scapularis]
MDGGVDDMSAFAENYKTILNDFLAENMINAAEITFGDLKNRLEFHQYVFGAGFGATSAKAINTALLKTLGVNKTYASIYYSRDRCLETNCPNEASEVGAVSAKRSLFIKLFVVFVVISMCGMMGGFVLGYLNYDNSKSPLERNVLSNLAGYLLVITSYFMSFGAAAVIGVAGIFMVLGCIGEIYLCDVQRGKDSGDTASLKDLDGKDVSACAPQKDVCGSCEARFYAKQQFLVCSAGCNRRFHCKCLNVTHEEYNFYMKSGTSAFKCSGCTRRSSASPRNDAAAGIGGVVPAPVAFVEPSNVTLDDGSVPPALLRLIESLSSKLDIVTAELKCLRADNNSLRSEVLHLRKSVHERMPLPSSSSTMYASVAALPPAAPTSVLRPRAAESLLNTVPGTNLGGAGLESSPSRGARAAGEKDAVGDGYTTVGPRRRTKPSAGTAKPSKTLYNSIVPPQVDITTPLPTFRCQLDELFVTS